MQKYQKRVRLKTFSYRGSYRYFITIVADKRNEIFISSEIAGQILKALKEVSILCQFAVWAYCFMPDHLHVLIEGKNEDSDMKELILKFKQKTAYEFKRLYQKRLWQENYYEHILRKDEDTKKAARYILENPVRKGLAAHVLNYPYVGSFEMDLKELYSDMM